MLNLVVKSAEATTTSAGITIDWGAIGLVAVAGFVVTLIICTSFAVGTRLLAVGASDIIVPEGLEADSPGVVDGERISPRPAIATLGAWICYAIGIAAVAYGIYMVIPAFHAH